MEISQEEAKNMSGWLEKKSPKTFGGYQKRFFKIVDGEYIGYKEKDSEKDDYKGKIQIDSIESVQKKEDNKFRLFMLDDDRTYHLKAKTKEIRDKWVAALELLLSLRENQQKTRSATIGINNSKKTEENNEEVITRPKSPSPSRKKGKKDVNKNIKLNKKLLDKRGINNLLSLSNPEIKKRFFSGFLKRSSKIKEREAKKKFWAILFSSRPLRNADYEKDDKMIDNSKLKDWLQFDTLFLFSADEEDDNEPIKTLSLKDCHSITCEDRDSKFYLSISIADQNYFFYNKFQEERDLWFEVLKNSRRTAKEIANSITKKPRNMARLMNIFEKKGKEGYFEELEKEEKKNLGNFLKIHDFETLLFVLSEFEKMITEIIDGCLLFHKENKNLFELTVDYYIELYLKIVSNFWESCYNRLDNEKIIKISNILFDFEDLLKKFRIDDENISKNANEFVKIYIKKIYKQLLEFIQNILKGEREIKQIENSNKQYITNGPIDLFSTLSNIISANKNIKVLYIHTYILNMVYEGIIQFLIGTDCITSNYNLKVEPEYLIAIANNTVEFIPLLNNFIEKYHEGCNLSEKKINNEIHKKSILNSLNLLRKNIVIRFVTQLSKPLAESFDCYYHLIDLTKIIDITSDIYFKYNTFMNDLVKKRVWEEVLKLTIYYYIKVLITTATMGIKTAEELIKKLIDDKSLLKEQYAIIVGDNLTLVNLQIFEDLITFFQSDPSLIVSACLPIRKYCGTIFDLQIIEKLLQFRTDLTYYEINEIIKECRESFYNCNGDKEKDYTFFEDMEINAERRISVVQRMKKKKEVQKEKEEGTRENTIENIDNSNSNQKPIHQVEELETNLFKFEDFIDDENDDNEEIEKEKENENDNDENEENEEDIKENENNIIKDEKVTDVIMEGKMKKTKKGNKKYQERYFQLKNGMLYWFSNERSRKLKNKILLKNIAKIESHGPTKIIIVVENPNDKDSGGNIYKFKTEDEKTKDAWIKAITEEIKKLIGEKLEKTNIVYKTELKKKCIIDILQLPDIGTERTNIKLQIIAQIKSEDFFNFIDEENRKKEQKEQNDKNIENYDPHEALFNEGKLEQYDVGLEEAREKNEDGCCESFLRFFTGGKKEKK